MGKHLQAYANGDVPDQHAYPWSDHGLNCPLTESLDTTECINGEQRP